MPLGGEGSSWSTRSGVTAGMTFGASGLVLRRNGRSAGRAEAVFQEFPEPV